LYDNQIRIINIGKDNNFIKRDSFEIIQVEMFQLRKSKINNSSFEIAEIQKKYNNLLEDINKKSEEINKLQDKINNIQLENSELKRSNNKITKNINFDDINKINNEIISPINNNSFASNSDKRLSNENISKIKQEKNKAINE
jgi:uncharacterized protein YoxC